MKINPGHPQYKKKVRAADTDIYEYFASRTGASKEGLNLFLKVLKEYLSLKLVSCQRVSIPTIGHLSLIKANINYRIKFRAVIPLTKTINRSLKLDYKDAVEAIKKDLAPVTTTVTDNECEKLIEDLRFVDLKPPKGFKTKVKSNYLQFSFLRYIQHDFPYEKDWTHPINNKVYKCKSIMRYILETKTSYPLGYAALYTMWVTIENRDSHLRQYGLSRRNVWKYLFKTIDLIIGQLILEGFTSD